MNKPKMRAFHNDPKIKKLYLDRVRAHRRADELIKGTYWENGKGCAVGCTIHGKDHRKYETDLGIPIELAFVQDRLFETVSDELSMTWPERFLKAIPVGADLSLVWPKFMVFMLSDKNYGVLRFYRPDEFPHVYNSVQNVLSLFQEWVDTGVKPSKRSFLIASTAATADTAAASAAAASAAAASAAAAGADQTRNATSEKLLELLKEAE